MVQNEKNSNGKKKPLLLFSPLDWGLGHTTRCIPLLREFGDKGYEIVVACNSTQKDILQQELPNAQFADLEGYNVKYAQTGRWTRWKIISQLRNILTKVKRENEWVAAFVAKNQVSALISDNRYGFCSSQTRSVFITHQLRPKSGFGRIADSFLQKLLFRYINQFSECWVPDYASENNFAGELSHPKLLPKPRIVYMGTFSRFDSSPANQPHNYILVVLSGPEPQRSILEQKLLKEINAIANQFVLVRGTPAAKLLPPVPENVQVHNHLRSSELNSMAVNAKYVICRAGYTSLMDMLKLKKKMIVIPTPGQTEQEYLAQYLFKKNRVLSFREKDFSLHKAITAAESFNYYFPESDTGKYKEVISEFIKATAQT